MNIIGTLVKSKNSLKHISFPLIPLKIGGIKKWFYKVFISFPSIKLANEEMKIKNASVFYFYFILHFLLFLSSKQACKDGVRLPIALIL